MGHDVKSIRKQFKEQGVFYTPPELVQTIKKYADMYKPNPKNVYDPTCGCGDLLAVYDVPKYGQEIDAEQLEEAKKRFNDFTGYAGDTLKDPAFMDMKFDLIVSNYPFSIKWEPIENDPRFCAPVLPPNSKADYAFILHILYMLADDGVAVVMGFPGILYRSQREQKIRQWIIENNYIERVVSISGKKFTDTAIATCILVLRKNKKNTDIVFEDTEHDIIETVHADAVEKNSYCLTVSNYCIYEEPKEEIDPIALEMEARQSAISKLEAQIQFSSLASTFHGSEFPPVSEFLDDIQKVIDKYR